MDAMVAAVDVHKYFGALHALAGVSLEVPRGDVSCIIGPSGSGKSTFLRCINQLERPDKGAIFVDGALIGYRRVGDALHELSDRELARQRLASGMVFQRFKLFQHFTVLQNVLEGRSRCSAGRGAKRARLGSRCLRASGSPRNGTSIRSSSQEGSSSAS